MYGWLSLLETCERGHTMSQGWLPPVLCLGYFCKNLRVPQCLMPPLASHKAQALIKPHVVRELGEAVSQNHQDGVSSVHQINVDSGLVPVLRLGPLAKVSEHIEASCCLPGDHQTPRVVQER